MGAAHRGPTMRRHRNRKKVLRCPGHGCQTQARTRPHSTEAGRSSSLSDRRKVPLSNYRSRRGESAGSQTAEIVGNPLLATTIAHPLGMVEGMGITTAGRAVRRLRCGRSRPLVRRSRNLVVRGTVRSMARCRVPHARSPLVRSGLAESTPHGHRIGDFDDIYDAKHWYCEPYGDRYWL